jgi:hypothetical protein
MIKTIIFSNLYKIDFFILKIILSIFKLKYTLHSKIVVEILDYYIKINNI